MSNHREEVEEFVVAPLRRARDHLHWLNVMQRNRLAGLLEEQIEADLRMAYELQGEISREMMRKKREEARLRHEAEYGMK